MGTISYTIKVSHIMSLTKETGESILNDEIDRALVVLPKGTTIVAKQQMPIVCLSVDTMVLFEHPAFESGSRLSMEYRRIAFVNGEGASETVGQANVLQKVRYFDKEDKELFV